MKLLNVKKIANDEQVKLVGLVQIDDSENQVELYFEYPKKFIHFLNDSADAFVPALLIPAMMTGVDLEIKPPVSEKLLRNLNPIQSIFHQWYPEQLKKVSIIADTIHQIKKSKKESAIKVGTFFSLGVDSFYTLHKDLRNTDSLNPSISHLIYTQGSEARLSNYQGQEEEVMSDIIKVANKAGKDYIFGKTNIRDVFPLNWGLYYHGAGLAATALSLSAGLEEVLIPSTHTYKDIFPWGSSPLVDHLWSTEKTIIIHDGSEVGRAEKTAHLSNDPLAMKYLRVCTRNQGGKLNCGQCAKCVRTMIALHISGNLAKAITFPDKLPNNFEKKIRVNNENDLSFLEENLALALKFNADYKITKTLQQKVKRGKMEIFVQKCGGFFKFQELLIYSYLIPKIAYKFKRAKG